MFNMTLQLVLVILCFTDDGSFRSVANICDHFGVAIALDLVIAIIIHEIDAYLLIQCQLCEMDARNIRCCLPRVRTRPHIRRRKLERGGVRYKVGFVRRGAARSDFKKK